MNSWQLYRKLPTFNLIIFCQFVICKNQNRLCIFLFLSCL
uniref:Uncharacterized protein n=1 Tax=Arundo donax TaxID=35708 RepID=A0A0A9CBU2_ARUDO